MPRKIPMRKCVATGEQLPKKELLRIVRTPEGTLAVDVTGRANGHGAYLKKDLEAVAVAKKKNSLGRALEMTIPDEFWEEIENAVKK
jgi:predicted RNA-binding protein YlxR (DUF448 family)